MRKLTINHYAIKRQEIAAIETTLITKFRPSQIAKFGRVNDHLVRLDIISVGLLLTFNKQRLSASPGNVIFQSVYKTTSQRESTSLANSVSVHL